MSADEADSLTNYSTSVVSIWPCCVLLSLPCGLFRDYYQVKRFSLGWVAFEALQGISLIIDLC